MKTKAMTAAAAIAAALACGAAGEAVPRNATLKTSGGPLVQAHRGSRGEYDDNALGGFAKCLESGVRGFETDIRFTKDFHLVVMHDDDISRTTDGKGSVESMTFDELRAFRLKKSGEPVPEIEEIMKLLGGRDDIFIELEMKPRRSEFYTPEVVEKYCRDLDAAAKRTMKPGTYAFTCFDPWVLSLMRKADPSAPIGLIAGQALEEKHLECARELGCCSVAPVLSTTKEMVDRAHAQGLTVCLWMCQDAKALAEAAAKGADRVTSDFPMRLAREAARPAAE